MVWSSKGVSDEGESGMTSLSGTCVRTCTIDDGWQ